MDEDDATMDFEPPGSEPPTSAPAAMPGARAGAPGTISAVRGLPGNTHGGPLADMSSQWGVTGGLKTRLRPGLRVPEASWEGVLASSSCINGLTGMSDAMALPEQQVLNR